MNVVELWLYKYILKAMAMSKIIQYFGETMGSTIELYMNEGSGTYLTLQLDLP